MERRCRLAATTRVSYRKGLRSEIYQGTTTSCQDPKIGACQRVSSLQCRVNMYLRSMDTKNSKERKNFPLNLAVRLRSGKSVVRSHRSRFNLVLKGRSRREPSGYHRIS